MPKKSRFGSHLSRSSKKAVNDKRQREEEENDYNEKKRLSMAQRRSEDPLWREEERERDRISKSKNRSDRDWEEMGEAAASRRSDPEYRSAERSKNRDRMEETRREDPDYRSSERARDRERKEESRRDGSYVAEESRKAREKYNKHEEKKAKEEQEREKEIERKVKNRKLILEWYIITSRKHSPEYFADEYPLYLDAKFKNDPESAVRLDRIVMHNLACKTCGLQKHDLTCGKCPEERCSSECFKNTTCQGCKAKLQHYHGIYQKWLEIRLKYPKVTWGGWALLANSQLYEKSYPIMESIIKHYSEGDFELHSMEGVIATNHIKYMEAVKGEKFYWTDEYSIYLNSLFQTLPYEEEALLVDDQRMFSRVCEKCGISYREKHCGKCSNGKCGSFGFMQHERCENLQCKGCQTNQDHYFGDYKKWAEKRVDNFDKSWVSWTKVSLTPYVDTTPDQD